MSLLTWAQRTAPKTSTAPVVPARAPAPVAAPQIIVPGQAPPATEPVLYSPAGMPAAQLTGLYGAPQGSRGPFVAIDPIMPTTVICRKDVGAPDNYAIFMRSRPDTLKANGIDYTGGFDATKMVSFPEGAARTAWTENTRYFNGLTDKTAPSFDNHVQGRTGMTLQELRQSGTHVLRAGDRGE